MNAVTQNHIDFAARLARIDQYVAQSTQMLFVGVDEAYVMPRRDRKPRVSWGRALVGSVMQPFGQAAAIAIGAVAHGLGQVLRFHVQGLPETPMNPDLDMAVQVAVGFGLAFVLGYVLQVRARAMPAFLLVGVVVGLLFGHNAVQQWPNRFAAMTSDAWIQHQTAGAPMVSVAWRGDFLPL